jgi:uncharacterized protein (DUF608 family)
MDGSKVNRRDFIRDGSTAMIGAATLVSGTSGAARAAEAGQAPATFRSPAGSDIPFARSELLAEGKPRRFTGEHLSQVAFPLGGIGTGTVSLGGRGDLRDWEIFNRPNKGRSLPFTFVTIWARRNGQAPVVRVVEAPPGPPYTGSGGFPRERAQGLPHMRGATFTGAYPLAEVAFDDPALPVSVTLEAFNPLIPLQVDDSALPVAILRYRLRNRSAATVDVSLAFSILNAIGYDGRSPIGSERFRGFGGNLTRLRREARITGLEMTSNKHRPGQILHGSMALVTTTADGVGARTSWEHGAWWDSFQKWFDEYAATGTVADSGEPQPSPDGESNYATLVPRLTLRGGESRDVAFILAWHFPTRENYWNREPEVRGEKLWNHYASLFPDAWAVAEHVAEHLERLERGTRAFRDALLATTLPSAVIDAVSSQMSIIRTNTCMLLEGRKFFAFEGTNDDAGCCPLNCTHVWNYEQALAHLFPELERSMRETDFTVNLRDDGSMAFRTLVPTGRALWQFKPAADGQMGCVLKLYREWQMSGDEEFLRRMWPHARRALEYAWQGWDADRDGVMEGEQHNTYDIEFYGPNTMMGTLYLGALVAGERMARAVGDERAAAEYRRVFESGSAKLDRELWADGFYVQRVPGEVAAPSGQPSGEAWHAAAVEQGKVKYQYGEGCLSDQLLGQWFATVAGLGPLLPSEHVRETLASIYRHNFKHSFHDHANTQRIYALNDEKGLLLCSWPRGKRPALPFVYSDEVWTGIEYQVAAHLIYEGLVMEGLAITKGVRDRYDGRRRNPWNEVECGSHYARALSSWSLLTALSGYVYSAPEAHLAFAPRLHRTNFRGLFTTGHGWGTFEYREMAGNAAGKLTLAGGEVTLRRFSLPFRPGASCSVSATLGGRPAAARLEGAARVTFDPAVVVRADAPLLVRVRGVLTAPR